MNGKLHLAVGLALISLITAFSPARAVPPPLLLGDPAEFNPSLSVQTFLDAEGRIDLEALRRSGYDGPLDMKGLCTRLNPRTGELIATPQSPLLTRIPGDEYWAPGFGAPDPIPGVDGSISCIAVYQGELIVGGDFYHAGGVDAEHIARWDGTSWISMPDAGIDQIFCATVYQDELVVGGHYGIRRWDGVSWRELGTGVQGIHPAVHALVEHNGVLFVGGEFDMAGGMMAPRIARWDGEVWAPVGPGFDGTVLALGVYNGELIAGGEFAHAGNTEVSNIARWNGLNWVPMGSGVSSGVVHALRQYGAGLIVGGSFSVAGGDSTLPGIARWDGTGWSALPGGGPQMYGAYVLALGERAGRLVVGGYIPEWNGQPAGNVIEWDGTSWWFMDSGMDGGVTCFTTFNGGLHAGGSFSYASGVQAMSVTRWDGATWSPLAEAPGAGLDGIVYALAAYQGSLVAGGWFYTAGTTPVNNIALWNGTSWAPLGEGLNNYVLALAVRDSDLYAGGGFNAAGGQEANYVARWDGSAWQPLGDGMNTVVKALALYQDDLYAGGFFTRADGMLVNHVARWDGSQWSGLGEGTDGVVNALAEFEGDLFVAGSFYAAGGMNTANIARWDGSTWNPFIGWPDGPLNALATYQGELVVGGDGVGARWTGQQWESMWLYHVHTLAVHNNWLIAGGTFTAGEEPLYSYNIARWDGRGWGMLGGGTNSSAEALASSGPDLFVGGAFTTAGGKSARHMARWTDPYAVCGLQFLEPTSADTLMAGQSVEILWGQSGDCSPYVRIDLLADGEECREITGQTENDGSYTWTVNSCYGEPYLHRIRITEEPEGSEVQSEYVMILPSGPCAGEGAWSGLFDPAGMDGPVLALLPGPEPGQVIAGGGFTQGGEVSLNHVGIWDGQAWSPMGSGLNGDVRALAWWQGSIVAGGDFTEEGSGGPVSHVARWEGSGWRPLGLGLNGPVLALVDYAGDLVAGGEFLQSGSTFVNYIARWNGMSWQPIDGGMDGPVLCLVAGDLWGENRLVAGGTFTNAGGSPASRVAQNWNGDWQAVGDGFNDEVAALSIVMDQYLIAAGGFTMSGSDTTAYVAYWDYEEWDWVRLGEEVRGSVRALGWFSGYLIAGGSFDEADGSVGNHIAAFAAQSWCPLKSGTSETVLALAAVGVGPDTLLYAGGEFTAADGLESNYIGRWRNAASSCPIDVIQPAEGENLQPDDLVEIQWLPGGACGTLARIELLNSGTPCATIAEMTESDGSYSWTVAPCGEGYPEDSYSIRVVDLDTGESGESGAFTITEDPSAMPDALLPARTLLFPCRPNPAAADVQLTLDLAQSSHLRLDVFDAAGRCVALLAQGQFPPGRYRLQWSGRDQEGNVVPSGVYLFQMKANGITQSRKVLLTR